ncbi:histone-like nucleoid-structuring protein Lsr2 [Microbacterium testaceum]|uniref:Lsr2 family DNA-binding protein n=1 Tax=Microbacterium testaceum TaxID=2033 RepID=UPI003448122F
MLRLLEARAHRGSVSQDGVHPLLDRLAWKYAAVRQWARENGHTVSDRGRVPATIVDAYKSANA